MKAGCAGTILKDFNAKVHGHVKFARVIRVIMSGLYKSSVLYFILMVEKVKDGGNNRRELFTPVWYDDGRVWEDKRGREELLG